MTPGGQFMKKTKIYFFDSIALGRNQIKFIEASCKAIMEKLGYGKYENYKVGPDVLEMDLDTLWNTWFLEDENSRLPKDIGGNDRV